MTGSAWCPCYTLSYPGSITPSSPAIKHPSLSGLKAYRRKCCYSSMTGSAWRPCCVRSRYPFTSWLLPSSSPVIKLPFLSSLRVYRRKCCCSSATGSAWCPCYVRSKGQSCGSPWCDGQAATPHTARQGCPRGPRTVPPASWVERAQLKQSVNMQPVLVQFLQHPGLKEHS